MNRGLQGFRAWLWQRLTSVYLALFTIVVLLLLLFAPPESHAEWRAWMSQPLMLIATGLFFITLLMHAWIGLRDVIVDYIHPFAVRFAVLSLAGLFLLGCGVWALKVLLLAATL